MLDFTKIDGEKFIGYSEYGHAVEFTLEALNNTSAILYDTPFDGIEIYVYCEKFVVVMFDVYEEKLKGIYDIPNGLYKSQIMTLLSYCITQYLKNKEWTI